METIHGRFENSAPHLTGRIEIPKLRVQETVSFLVDTGADMTTLHPPTIKRMGIKWADYEPTYTDESEGIAGGALYGLEDAIIYFGNTRIKQLVALGPLCLELYCRGLEVGTPSVLGMDVIGLGQLLVDYVERRITLDLP